VGILVEEGEIEPVSAADAYVVDVFRVRGGRTLLVTRQDHGLRIMRQQVEETYAPLRRMEGQCRFRLAAMASTMGGD
jgi:hypothetical protein